MSLPLFPVAMFGGDVVFLPATDSASSIRLSGTATAQYQLLSNGHIAETANNNIVVDQGSWVLPNSRALNYECFATLNSGALTSGTTGAWLALTADRIWTLSKTGPGGISAQITVQIRLVGSAVILATSVVTLNAEIQA